MMTPVLHRIPAERHLLGIDADEWEEIARIVAEANRAARQAVAAVGRERLLSVLRSERAQALRPCANVDRCTRCHRWFRMDVPFAFLCQRCEEETDGN